MGVLADEYIRLRPDVSRMPREVRKAGIDAGKQFHGSFADSSKRLIKGGLVAAGLTGGALFGAALKKGFGRLSAIEDAEAKLTGLGHSAKTVDKIMVNALNSVKGTAFGLDEAATVAATAVASGIKPGKELEGTLKLVADAATIGGSSLSDMGAIFSEVAASNKIQGDTINQLNERGIPILKLLADVTGKSQGEVRDLASKGKIDFATFQKAMEKGLGGAALDSGKTASGAFKNMGAAFGRVGAALLKDVFPKIGEGITGVTTMLDDILPAAEDLGKAIGDVIKSEEMKTAVGELKTAIQNLTGDEDLAASLKSMAEQLPVIVGGLGDALTKYKEFSDFIDAFEKKSFGEGDKVGGPAGRFVKDFGAGGTIEVALVHARGIIGPALDSIFGTGGVVEGAMVKARTAVTSTFGAGGTIEQAVIQFRGFIGRHVKEGWAVVKSLWAAATAWVRDKWNVFWTAIKAIAQTAFIWVRNRISAIWATVRSIWAAATTWVRDKWSTFWTGVKKVGSDAINSVKTTIDSVLGKIKTGFDRGVAAIGRAWDKIKEKARVPVAFVVNTVLNDGLLRAFRAVSKLVNYGPGEKFSVSMARGGVLPGYTPGRDVHRFYSATGGRIDLSGGEGIARPEIVRAIGKKRWDAANNEAMHGRISRAVGYLGGFFLGGQAPVPGSGNRHSGYPWATWAGDFPNPTGTPVRAWASGRVAAVKNWNYSYGRHVRINHPGNKQTLYAHLLRSIVSVGQAIGRGNVLGYVDSTGNSTGPHLHFELKGGQGVLGGKNGAGALAPLISAAKYIAMVASSLGKLKGIGGGQFGQMAAAAARLIGSKVKDKITSLVSSFNSANAGSSGSGFTSVSGGSNRAIGKRMMLQRWPASQWPALNSLWTKESGWRTTARNPSSGAYGIPQSLPASKMASAGSDWRTNPATQIKWGLGYISQRYGNPIAAWRHSQRTNWYGMGGTITEPVLGIGMRTGQSYGFGEHGPETVTPGRGGGRPINIHVHYDQGIVQVIQGVIDDNDQFKQTVGRAR